MLFNIGDWVYVNPKYTVKTYQCVDTTRAVITSELSITVDKMYIILWEDGMIGYMHLDMRDDDYFLKV